MHPAPPAMPPASAGRQGWRSAFHGMRVSTRVLLIIATCLVPTLALQVALSWNQWSDRKDQLGELVTQQAQLLAGNVDGIADAARVLLGAASEYNQVRTRGEHCDDRLAALLAHAPGFAFVALVNHQGRVDCASHDALLREPPDAPWLAAASGITRFTAGRFARAGFRPDGFLPFYLPLRGDGAGVAPGAVVAGLDLGWLGDHLQGLKRNGLPFLVHGVLTVADADGVVLGRDTRHAEFVGRRFPPAAAPLLTATEPGILRLRSLDGTDRLVGYTPPNPASHNLAAVVGFQEGELMGPMGRTLIESALLAALATLLAILMTLLVARRFIARPTRALVATARRWREGDLAARAPACDPRSEFGQIAAAYNEMAAALQRREEELRHHADTLETAVATRTQELTETNQRLHAEIAEHRSTAAALMQAQKVQAVGQLAGGIAHDFNNVLQAVLGGVTLIRRRAADPDAVQRLARMVEESARRGETVTRRLLTFSRRQELRAEPLDMRALLEGLRDVLAATLGARIRVGVVVGPGLPAILADRGQLETMLVNLATNARDAMPQGGTLTLSADLEELHAPADGLAPGRYVRLAVADTGEGMAPETLAHAAEPFFTTKPLGHGTGLGLAMARSFAQGSGGQLSIASRPGAGTTVTLWLPVAAEPAVAPPAPARRRATPPADHRRILLVDDEPTVRSVLAAQLEDAGWEVLQAADGTEALDLLEHPGRIDVLVSDLAMPGMDGVALIREAQHRLPALPAILVTGYAGDAATLAVGRAVPGRVVLMRKPVEGADLSDQAAGLLATSRPRLAPAE